MESLWQVSWMTRQPKWWCAAELQHPMFAWYSSGVNPFAFKFLHHNEYLFLDYEPLFFVNLASCLCFLASDIQCVLISFVLYLNHKPRFFYLEAIIQVPTDATFWCFIATKPLEEPCQCLLVLAGVAAATGPCWALGVGMKCSWYQGRRARICCE